jgi:transcription elongation factor Elf1
MPVVTVQVSKRVMVGNVQCDDCGRHYVQARAVNDYGFECPFCCLKKAVAGSA